GSAAFPREAARDPGDLTRGRRTKGVDDEGDRHRRTAEATTQRQGSTAAAHERSHGPGFGNVPCPSANPLVYRSRLGALGFGNKDTRLGQCSGMHPEDDVEERMMARRQASARS